jgi:1,4-dihydroxy-2-naphthoate octaprenyltransferase
VAFVEEKLQIGPALAAGAGALLLQIGSNLANDVYDFEKGADTEERRGPPRAAQLGLLSPVALKGGMLVVFALATLVGVYLTWVAGPLVVAIGLASIAAAIAYTGGPWPLGYHGLGEIAVFVFFGLAAVVGTTFVQTGSTPALAWVAAIPVGGLATAILVVNNLRDIATDRIAGKRTLAVRWGAGAARAEWAIVVFGAYLMTLVAWLAFGRSIWLFLPWLSLPRAIALWRVVRTSDSGLVLNEALAQTAQLGVLFSLLFAVGLAFGLGT